MACRMGTAAASWAGERPAGCENAGGSRCPASSSSSRTQGVKAGRRSAKTAASRSRADTLPARSEHSQSHFTKPAKVDRREACRYPGLSCKQEGHRPQSGRFPSQFTDKQPPLVKGAPRQRRGIGRKKPGAQSFARQNFGAFVVANATTKAAEPADKPGPVVDSHSSRRIVTDTLKQPTRTRRGPRHEVPIWPCSRWGLPCRPVTRLAVRSYRTISPLPVPHAPKDARPSAVSFCCTFRRLAPPRRYLAPCPVEPGLS